MKPNHGSRWSPLACLAGLLLFTVGCQTDNKGKTSGLEMPEVRATMADVKAVEADFVAGRFDRAYHAGGSIASNPINDQNVKEAASFFAGASSYRLKNSSRAIDYLNYAAASSDKKLAADAKATLGLVYTDMGRYGPAAENLLAAAENLNGQDKANAYYYGAIAQQKIGQWPSARTNLSLALSTTKEPGFKARVTEQMKVTGYQLQLGAFTSPDNAKKLAELYNDKAVKLSMGATRVTTARDPDGKTTLHLVHVGQFTSWSSAIMQRERLGMEKAIIVPLQESK